MSSLLHRSFARSAAALLLVACGDVDGTGRNILVDGTVDGPDGSVPDAPGESDAPAPFDTGESFDAPTDVGCDAACPAPEPCMEYVGCDCIPTPLADDTSCGTHGETCQGEVCTPPAPGCGSFWRDLSPTREGCDDGNTENGDACSSTCTPTLLVLASPSGERASDVAMASDGSGRMLFAWVESVTPTEAVERTLSVRAAIYSATGVLEVFPFDLETGIGLGQPVTPSVAGLTIGWAIAWRSTTIEGSDADLGGIAYAVIDHDATPIRVRQANEEERFDQRDPNVLGRGAGFEIAWTDGSDRSGDPGLGVRTRSFLASGLPNGKTRSVDRVDGDQSQPFLTATSANRAIAFTDRSTDVPLVMLRRASDTNSGPLSYDWSSSPVLSGVPSGDLWAAWVGFPGLETSEPDLMGGIHVRFVAATGPVTFESDITYGTIRREDGAVIAATSSTEVTVGWRTDDAPQGLRVEPIGWTFPTEHTDLEDLLRGHRERGLRLLATYDGLWLAWTTESLEGATSSTVAYLLPWN